MPRKKSSSKLSSEALLPTQEVAENEIKETLSEDIEPSENNAEEPVKDSQKSSSSEISNIIITNFRPLRRL